MVFFRRPFKYVYCNITLILIAVNVLVFAAQYFIGNLTGFLAMTPVLVLHGFYWQFFTYMFAHQGFAHIFFNMFALFVFGTQIERHIGSKEFLLYYLVTGVLAGVFSFFVYLFTGAYLVSLLGASGAIFAVQLAFACFFPRAVMYVWGLIPMRAPILVTVFTLLELGMTIFGVQNGVAHLTHLAGFGFGWLYFYVRWRANPLKLMLEKN
ncbi:MAG: rhomboid family intramembrane serine protease [Spirochaetaceae bacterium]|jgi:membrane associated rhomboid family serine protease|nr:rhomboid family intramembrane serine protease [Spirochaetaceae bacterium]